MTSKQQYAIGRKGNCKLQFPCNLQHKAKCPHSLFGREGSPNSLPSTLGYVCSVRKSSSSQKPEQPLLPRHITISAAITIKACPSSHVSISSKLTNPHFSTCKTRCYFKVRNIPTSTMKLPTTPTKLHSSQPSAPLTHHAQWRTNPLVRPTEPFCPRSRRHSHSRSVSSPDRGRAFDAL